MDSSLSVSFCNFIVILCSNVVFSFDSFLEFIVLIVLLIFHFVPLYSLSLKFCFHRKHI